MEYNHTPVILVFLLDVDDLTYRQLRPQLIDCVARLEVDDCAVLFNSQDSFSTAKGVTISALSDYQPFPIKLSQWVQVLVKSIGSFNPNSAIRTIVIADEFKKVDEFKLTMALDKNSRENESSVFHFISLRHPNSCLKELASQGQCRHDCLNISEVGDLVTQVIKQASGVHNVTSIEDLDALKRDLEQMETSDEDRERGED